MPDDADRGDDAGASSARAARREPSEARPGAGDEASTAAIEVRLMTDTASVRTLPAAWASGLSRRSFLSGVGGAVAVGLTGGLAGPAAAPPPAAAAPPAAPVAVARQRAQAACQIREEAARYARDLPLPAGSTNGDEHLSRHVGSYSKGLPHDELGQVDEPAYAALLAALATGRASDLEQVPLGGVAKLVNPQSAWCFGLDAPDSHHLDLPAPPALRSPQRAAEMAEVYWRALTRDVPFTDYASEPVTGAAARDLTALEGYSGPRVGRAVTTYTLFRGSTPGELTGPYLSQFLWKDVPWGPSTVQQRYRSAVAGLDYGTTPAEWLALQRGVASQRPVLDAMPRYIRDGRSLASWVHSDFSYQAFLSAALILLDMPGTTHRNNPYRSYTTQAPFVTFGGPFVLDLVARAALAALRAAWYQKWLLHRTLRPEVFAGRLHHQLAGRADYGLHEDIVSRSAAPAAVRERTGNVLLPLAYPEGSPTHPSYPAGHAAVAGACATMLKACMDETAAVPEPVEANADGSALHAYRGEPLTVGGELNKLASNISLGRDAAGVHYRSDGAAGMLLGEQVALGLLREMRAVHHEPFDGFDFTRFDGTHMPV